MHKVKSTCEATKEKVLKSQSGNRFSQNLQLFQSIRNSFRENCVLVGGKSQQLSVATNQTSFTLKSNEHDMLQANQAHLNISSIINKSSEKQQVNSSTSFTTSDKVNQAIISSLETRKNLEKLALQYTLNKGNLT